MSRPSLGGIIIPLMLMPGVVALLVSVFLFLSLDGWQAFIVGPLYMISSAALLLMVLAPRRHVLAMLIVCIVSTVLATASIIYFYGGLPENLLPR